MRISFTLFAVVIFQFGLFGQESTLLPPAGLAIDFEHGTLHCQERSIPPLRVRLGNENIQAIYESCSRAPIAVVANATSVIGEGHTGNSTHLIDTLLTLGSTSRRYLLLSMVFGGTCTTVPTLRMAPMLVRACPSLVCTAKAKNHLPRHSLMYAWFCSTFKM